VPPVSPPPPLCPPSPRLFFFPTLHTPPCAPPFFFSPFPGAEITPAPPVSFLLPLSMVEMFRPPFPPVNLFLRHNHKVLYPFKPPPNTFPVNPRFPFSPPQIAHPLPTGQRSHDPSFLTFTSVLRRSPNWASRFHSSPFIWCICKHFIYPPPPPLALEKRFSPFPTLARSLILRVPHPGPLVPYCFRVLCESPRDYIFVLLRPLIPSHPPKKPAQLTLHRSVVRTCTPPAQKNDCPPPYPTRKMLRWSCSPTVSSFSPRYNEAHAVVVLSLPSCFFMFAPVFSL